MLIAAQALVLYAGLRLVRADRTAGRLASVGGLLMVLATCSMMLFDAVAIGLIATGSVPEEIGFGLAIAAFGLAPQGLPLAQTIAMVLCVAAARRVVAERT